MAVVRRIDTEATALQRQGELGAGAPLLGQEAAQIGSARALRPDDFVVPSYREHAVAYCRGVAPSHAAALARDRLSGWDPFASAWRRRPSSSAAQALHATGYAMGFSATGPTPPPSPTSAMVPRVRATSTRP